MKNIFLNTLLVVVALGLLGFIAYKTKIIPINSIFGPSSKISSETIANPSEEIYKLYNLKNELEKSFADSINYLNKIPTVKDNTYKLKRESAAASAKDLLKQKNSIFIQSKKKVIEAIEENLSAEEKRQVIQEFKEQKAENNKNKIMQKVFNSPKYRENFRLPREEMRRYYQFYLDQFRKIYNIPEGEFAMPEKNSTN
jgi:hypothetical protein